jgi:hypothetical protein
VSGGNAKWGGVSLCTISGTDTISTNNCHLFCYPFLLDALITCVCSDCDDGTCFGDICYSHVSVSREPGSDPVYRQRCYFESQANLCNTSTSFHAVLCCESDRCNADLDPVLFSGDSSTSSADYLSSTELSPSTDSEDGGNSNSEPTVIGKHEYNAIDSGS